MIRDKSLSASWVGLISMIVTFSDLTHMLLMHHQIKMLHLDKRTFLQFFVYTRFCFMHVVCFVIVIFGHTCCFDVKLILQYHIVLETINAKLEDLTPMFIIIEVIKRVRI